MTIYDVRDALVEVLNRVYHYYASQAAADSGEPYAVWGETGITSLAGDDGPAEWAVSGVIYYYTREEYDPLFDALCASLAEHGVSFRPGRIGYDDTTRTISYEVEWSVTAEPCGIYAEPEDDE